LSVIYCIHVIQTGQKTVGFSGAAVFYKLVGSISIVVSLLVLAPSVVPGSMSILASYIALLALLSSIFTIKSGNVFYFKTTTIISAIGIFIVNDGLRLYGALPQIPWSYRLSTYGVFIIICVVARLYAKKRVGI
jgi:hypothetical protein